MKKVLLLVAATAAICQPAAGRAPQPVNPPAEVPMGITVSPAQGFVDIANTAYPKGVSSIGFTFSQEVMPNPNNDQPALLYYNDFNTPAEKSLATSVDALTWLTVGVLFKERTWVLPGQYKVEIPEGMFVYVSGTVGGERTGTQHTPALTLYYEIYRGYTMTPGSGTVADITEAVLRFTDADEVKPTAAASQIQFYLDNSDNTYTCGYVIKDNDGDGKVNDVVFTFATSDGKAVTAPGVYGLNIPAGAFTSKTYGPDYASDPADCIDYQNNEILVKYTIPQCPPLEIDPDPSVAVKEFDEFLVYLPDGFQLFFPDTRGKSVLYKVDEDGNVDTTRAYVNAIAEFPEEGMGFVTLRLYDPLTNEQLDKYVPPTNGAYCLRTVADLLYGVWPAALAGGSDFIGGCAPYDYFYTVKNPDIEVGVDGVSPDMTEAASGVYNLCGVKVAEHIGDLARLPKGIYISGGRKVMVK